MLLHLTGRIATLFLLNLRTLITKNLEIGAKKTTILIHQVLTIRSQTIYQKTMFNVSIAGRLTKDAEYKKAGAYDMAVFTVAVSHGRDKTSFIECQLWGKRFESVLDTYKKGCLVAVSGQGEYRKYETDDGDEKYQFRLNVDQFLFPEKREQSSQAKLDEATIPF